MNVIECLEKSHRLIENGWCQHMLTKHGLNGELEVCLMGALQTSRVDLPVQYEAIQLLHKELKPRWRGVAQMSRDMSAVWELVLFNNDSSTTKEEVLDLFKRTIDKNKPAPLAVEKRELVDA